MPFTNDHLDAFFNAAVDAGIALSTALIAAEAVGLGGCPISVIRDHAQWVSEQLELPDHVFPVAGLALGWPQETGEISKRLPLAATVHRNRFDDSNVQQQVDEYDRWRSANQGALAFQIVTAGPKTRRGSMPTRSGPILDSTSGVAVLAWTRSARGRVNFYRCADS
jgi:hypothetical protein